MTPAKRAVGDRASDRQRPCRGAAKAKAAKWTPLLSWPGYMWAQGERCECVSVSVSVCREQRTLGRGCQIRARASKDGVRRCGWKQESCYSTVQGGDAGERPTATVPS